MTIDYPEWENSEIVETTLRRSSEAYEEAPGRIYDHVGHIRATMDLDRRAAMAAAARSRGETTSLDEELASVREELRELEPDRPDPDLEIVRRRVAETSDEIDRLRERVATYRGRLLAHRERGDPERAESEYRRTIRRLSEVETEYAAALEAFEDAQRRARRVRDDREKRLRLSDRAENLERKVRDELIRSIEPTLEHGIRAAPGDAESISGADDTTLALAIARAASISVPIVLSCRRFSTAEAASSYLRTPVIRL